MRFTLSGVTSNFFTLVISHVGNYIPQEDTRVLEYFPFLLYFKHLAEKYRLSYLLPD